MVELVLRLAFSLAVVLGLLSLLTRLSAKRFRGGTDAPIRVVHRQALSRGSAVAVVSVGSRVLVIGTTEQQVSLLTELDPEELELEEVEDVEQVEAPTSKVGSLALPAWLPTRRAPVPAVAPVPAGAPAPVAVPVPAGAPAPVAVPAPVAAARADVEPVELVSLHEDVSLDDLLGTPDELDDALLAGLARTTTRRTVEDRRTRTRRAVQATTASQGVLAGSALSAQTWRQAFTVATRKQQDAS